MVLSASRSLTVMALVPCSVAVASARAHVQVRHRRHVQDREHLHVLEVGPADVAATDHADFDFIFHGQAPSASGYLTLFSTASIMSVAQSSSSTISHSTLFPPP